MEKRGSGPSSSGRDVGSQCSPSVEGVLEPLLGVLVFLCLWSCQGLHLGGFWRLQSGICREPLSPQGLSASFSPLESPARHPGVAHQPLLEGSNMRIRNSPQTPTPTLKDHWTLHSLIKILLTLLHRHQKAAFVVLTNSAIRDIREKEMLLSTLTTFTRSLFLYRTDLLRSRLP